MRFKDRRDAGVQLAQKLLRYKDNPNAIVLGLPRGGVVTASVVAEALNAPLDIVVPRKIGAPGNSEYAIGAIAENGTRIFDEQTIAREGIGEDYLRAEIEKEKKEAVRRLEKYRGDRPPLDLKGKIAILADDGIATGATMRAAIASAKAKGASKIVVAVPVAARDSIEKIQKEADEIFVLETPPFFGAVGEFYERFDQTSDEEVASLMRR